MRKIRNIAKRMIVVAVSASMLVTSLPASVLAAELEAAAGDAEAYLAGVSDPAADYAEAQEDISSSGDLSGNEDTSGDMDAVTDDPEESSDESLSGDDPADQEDAVISDDPMDDDTDTDETSEEETDDELFGLEEPEETEPLGDPAPSGVTGTGTEAEPWVVGTWTQLSEKMAEGGFISLGADVSPGEGETYLSVPSEKDVTLDLSGHIIDRALTEAVENGYVIKVEGTLTLKDSTETEPGNGTGTVKGGYNTGYGGGLLVDSGGAVNLLGGEMSGNKAANGGGVYSTGTVIMSGGSINDNTAGCGGGVETAGGTMDMQGGSINSNYAGSGGGVFLSGVSSFSISGGSICDNSTYVSELGTGGGVSVSGRCSFTMSGGRISGNISCYGGGISSRAVSKTSVVSITGGEITGNTVRDCIEEEDGVIYRYTGKGGGIHVRNRYNILNVSGSSRITGNKHDDMDDNVLLDNYGTADPDPGVITVTGTLNEDAQIGVGMSESGGVITSGLKGNGTLSNFTSDRGSEIVLDEAGEALLCSGVARIVTRPEPLGKYSLSYGNQLSYNGRPAELVTPGEAVDGTMMYAFGSKDKVPEKDSYSEEIPTADCPGHYYIYYYAKGNGAYADSDMPSKYDAIHVEMTSGVGRGTYYAAVGETVPVSDIMAFLGLKGEAEAVAKIFGDEHDPENLIVIEKDAEGKWTITARQEHFVGIEITVNGNRYDVTFQAPPPDPTTYQTYHFTFDPNYEGSELIHIESAKSQVYSPEITRPGYRLVAWVDHLTEEWKPEDGDNGVMWHVFPGRQAMTIFGTRNTYYYAVWEPLEPDALTDVNVMQEKNHVVRINGKNWLQIGEGGGKSLFLVEDPIGAYDAQGNAINYCSTLYNDSFTDQEKAAVLPHDGNAGLFLLSAQEAFRYLPSPPDRSSSDLWWLRNKRYYINKDGFLRENNSNFGTPASRPAFVLDESAVLLESDAIADGKPEPGYGFRKVSHEGVQKYTFMDPGRAFTATPAGSSCVSPGGRFAIDYQGAGIKENECISALLESEEGEAWYSSYPVRYINGTWEIPLPADLEEGRYQLKIFSEERNGTDESDYASVPVILPVYVSNSTFTEVTISNGDKTGDQTVTYGDEITLKVTGADRARNATVTWTSSDPAVVSVDRTSGKIRARKVGTATVTAEYRSKNSVGIASAVITVEPRLLTLTVNGPTEYVFDNNYHYPDITLNGVLDGDTCSIITPKYKRKDGFDYSRIMVNEELFETNWVMFMPGTYTIRLTSSDLSNSNYAIEDWSVQYTVQKVQWHVDWGETEFEYDGNVHSPAAELTVAEELKEDLYIQSVERWFAFGKTHDDFTVTGGETEPGSYIATAVYTATDEEYYYDHCQNVDYSNYPFFYYLPPLEEEMTKEFRIVKADIGRAEVTLGAPLTYKGYVQPQSIASVKIGDLEVPSDDYVITGNTAKDAGTYKLTITAKEDSAHFTGTKEVEFTIAKKSITPSVRVGDGMGIQTYPFTGKEITPGFEVRESFGSENLLTDKDYSCTITDNVNAGEGKITITAKEDGNYSFAPKAVNFTIDPVLWEGGDTAELSRNYLFNEKVSDGIDLSEYLPENCGEIRSAVLEPLSGSITYEAGREPKIVGNNLTYTVSGNGAASGTITAALSTQNYSNTFTVKVKVRQQAMGLFEKISKDSEPLRITKALTVGKSFTLLPKFYDDSIKNTRVVWHSSDPGVATVTQDGKVTAMAAGSSVITAVSEHDADEVFTHCTVTVTEPVTSVTLDEKSYPFGTGEIYDLTAQLLPFTAVQDVIWSTSDKNVAIIYNSKTGEELAGGQAAGKGWTYGASSEHTVRIKAVNPGNVKITAEAVDGSGKKASCSFTVGNPVPDGFTITSKGGTDLAAGKTLTLAADWGAKTDTPKNTGLTWKVVKAEDGSDASSIAAISAKGVLTGLSEGKVKVIATSTANNEKRAESPEISVYVPVKSAALNMTSATLSTAENSNAIDLSVNVVSAVEGKTATGEEIGQPVTVSYELDPSYSDENSRDYNKTKNYKKYIKVSPAGVVTADAKAMAKDDVASLSKLNVLATVRGYGYTKVLTCKVSVAAANPLKGMKLSKTSLSLGEGNTFALTAALDPVNPDGDTGLVWESDNPNVTVDENGVITAGKYEEGKTAATITVTTKQKVRKRNSMEPLTASCKVTVVPSVSRVEFTNATSEENMVNRIIIGKTFTVKTAFTSSAAGKKASADLIWSSSDESVATVSQKGAVKAIGNGVATITATSADAKRAGETAPSVSARFEVYTPVAKLAPDKTKLTLGTQRGSRYGRVCTVDMLPLDVTDPSVEWKTSGGAVKIAAADNGETPLLNHYIDATGKGLDGTKNETGDGVTVGAGQYLAVMAVTPGVVTLTGITKDGSNKKVTCTVTVRGETTGMKLKKADAKGGVNDVTLADNPDTENVVEYTSTMKPGGTLTLTPLIDINGISAVTEDNEEKKLYSTYKKYTDMGVAFRSSDADVVTVDKKGKISVKKGIEPPPDPVTVYAISADGKLKAQIAITVTN